MFNKRTDGIYTRLSDPFFRVMANIMPARTESQVLYEHTFDADILTDYLKTQHESGLDITFLSLFIACYVRMLKEHPQINRFIVNRRLYCRNGIHIAFVIKKRLDPVSAETAIKLSFTGEETLIQVQKIVQAEIDKNIKTGGDNQTDAVARFFNSLPNALIRFGVGLSKFADAHNMLPKFLIEASPFHCSMFITYVKSIKLDRVYHHLYNFGTCSVFAGIGKTMASVGLEQNEFAPKRTITIAYAIDERICDGYAMAKAFKTVEKLLKNPELLEQPLKTKTDA